MASAIKQNTSLPNTVNLQETEQNKMEGDDSHLVDEILNELNDGTDLQNTQTNPMNNIDPQLQMDPQMDMTQQPNLEQQVNELPPIQQIEYDSEESKFSGIFEMIKKPLIIACLSFIIFNPMVISALSNYIPKIFGPTESVLLRQGRTFILAVLDTSTVSMTGRFAEMDAKTTNFSS